MVTVRVGVDDGFDRLVGDFTKFFDDCFGCFGHHAGVDDDHTVVANDHRDVGHTVTDGNVDVVGDLHDLFFELFVLLGQFSRCGVVLREREARQGKCGG